MNKENSIGIVKQQKKTFLEELILESGKKLESFTLAYEIYGTLNEDKTNAVLICHALSGDAHAAGYHSKNDKRPGWWDMMIGPNKAFDTNKYFVICSNVLGGCKGSTGPASINEKTDKPYGIDFPIITIADMVNAQKRLIESIGIKKLLSVAGGSMGGMQVLQWVSAYVEMVASAIPIATTWKHSPQQIAFSEVCRQAVMADPDWAKGNYFSKGQPQRGLALARMIGHITYMSDSSMEKKFSRKKKQEAYSFSFKTDFEVEGYLKYRGDSFVKRFDANSYLYITKAMDYFDLSQGNFVSEKTKIHTRFLVMAFDSDWLYPSHQSISLVRFLKQKRVEATYCQLKASYGHDSFLIESKEQSKLIKNFLSAIYKKM